MTPLVMVDRAATPDARLRDELYLLRTAVEASHDVIFVVNRHGQIEYVNAAVNRLLRRPSEALIGQRFADLFQPSSVDIMRRDLEAVFTTGAPQYFEDRFDLPNRTLWLGTWLVPMPHPGEPNASRAM